MTSTYVAFSQRNIHPMLSSARTCAKDLVCNKQLSLEYCVQHQMGLKSSASESAMNVDCILHSLIGLRLSPDDKHRLSSKNNAQFFMSLQCTDPVLNLCESAQSYFLLQTLVGLIQ